LLHKIKRDTKNIFHLLTSLSRLKNYSIKTQMKNLIILCFLFIYDFYLREVLFRRVHLVAVSRTVFVEQFLYQFIQCCFNIAATLTINIEKSTLKKTFIF